MRIRKNKKLTASMIWSTAASPSSPNPPEELMQTHVCVLNRSPWDAPLSPPPLDYPLAHDFLPSPISSHHQHHQAMEEEDDEDDMYAINGSSACDDSLLPDDNSRRSNDSMKISSDYDNKSSMSMSILPAPSSTAANTNSNDKDKASSAMGPPRRRGRPKKVVTQPHSSLPPPANPNEFYYYSGFGPRWGKRRGGGDHQKQSAPIDKGKDNAAPSSTDDELDYIDDDYEDDDDVDEEMDGSRKRTRKLVKARSLKSLM